MLRRLFAAIAAWLRPAPIVIHKVEITVSSTRPAGEIARAVIDQLQGLHQHRKSGGSSPFHS